MPEQTTVDDVIAHVAATEGWQLKSTGIRRRLPDGPNGTRRWACPITSMCDLTSGFYAVAGYRMGLGESAIIDIGSAADLAHVPGSELYSLRRRLLAAAKLTEQDA